MDAVKDFKFMKISKDTKIRLLVPKEPFTMYQHKKVKNNSAYTYYSKSKNTCLICKYNRKQKRIKLIKSVLSKLIFWSNK